MAILFSIWPVVGLVQLVGAVIRTLRCKDWSSTYGRGLKYYWLAVGVFAIVMFWLFDERQSDEIFAPMIGLSIPIAVYYWVLVYGLAKKSNP